MGLASRVLLMSALVVGVEGMQVDLPPGQMQREILADKFPPGLTPIYPTVDEEDLLPAGLLDIEDAAAGRKQQTPSPAAVQPPSPAAVHDLNLPMPDSSQKPFSQAQRHIWHAVHQLWNWTQQERFFLPNQK